MLSRKFTPRARFHSRPSDFIPERQILAHLSNPTNVMVAPPPLLPTEPFPPLPSADPLSAATLTGMDAAIRCDDAVISSPSSFDLPRGGALYSARALPLTSPLCSVCTPTPHQRTENLKPLFYVFWFPPCPCLVSRGCAQPQNPGRPRFFTQGYVFFL